MTLTDQRVDQSENVGNGATNGPIDTDAQATSHRSAKPLMWLFGGLLAMVGSLQLSDNSFLTHLATGRLIISEGLPRTNPFLFTGTSFPVPSYWWSILLGVVDRLAGGLGLRLMTMVLAGLLGMLIVRLTAGRRDIPFMGSKTDVGILGVVVPSVFAVLCLFPFIEPRPHLAGFILLALMVIVWREKRSPWWLVPIFVLWVNMHGTWLYGLVVLGLFVAADVIDGRQLRRDHFELAGAALIGTLIGGALYPDRFALVLLPTRQFGSPVERKALQMYSEWARVGLDNPLMWMMVGLAIISLFGAIRHRRYAMSLVVVLLVVMGVSGVRLAPIAALALLPLAAFGLREAATLRLPAGRTALICSGLGIAMCLGAMLNCFRAPHYNLEMYPVAGIDWLDERNLVGGEIRTVSHDYVGNYLEWRYGADANVFVDDRPDAATFLDYGTLLRASPGWQKVLTKADGDVIVWRTKDALTAKLNKDRSWVKSAELDDFTVFCRQGLASRCQ